MSQDTGREMGGYRSYITGYVIALVLSAASFWVAMGGALSGWSVFAVLAVLALVQILVHLKFFLHLGLKTEKGRFDMLTLAFTTLVLVRVVGLSGWIIYASNAVMMG